MRTILKGYKVDETFPLPCYTKGGVLKYDAKWADDLVCRCYGTDTSKYEIHESTLELYYIVSKKMRFKVAEITYESFFTDIQGKDWEDDWLETWVQINKGESNDMGDPQDYEMYNLTLFHYDHPALKSQLLDKNGKLRGINSEEYLKGIMEKIEREDYEDDEEDGPSLEDILGGDDEDDDDPYYK